MQAITGAAEHEWMKVRLRQTEVYNSTKEA